MGSSRLAGLRGVESEGPGHPRLVSAGRTGRRRHPQPASGHTARHHQSLSQLTDCEEKLNCRSSDTVSGCHRCRLSGSAVPSGKLPYTMYTEAFAAARSVDASSGGTCGVTDCGARHPMEMDLRAQGGVTSWWSTQPVLYPFGTTNSKCDQPSQRSRVGFDQHLLMLVILFGLPLSPRTLMDPIDCRPRFKLHDMGIQVVKHATAGHGRHGCPRSRLRLHRQHPGRGCSGHSARAVPYSSRDKHRQSQSRLCSACLRDC